MNYNFKDYLNRRKTGSTKWANMDLRNKNVNEKTIPFSVADMEFKTCPEITKGIVEYVENETLGYCKPVDSYLDSVVEFFKVNHKYNGKKEWIVTTPGIVSALATSVRTLTNIGDNVLIFTPVYRPFYKVIEEQERKIVNCPLIYKENNYYIDFENLEKSIVENNVKLILFCSPHNPSGRVWKRQELEKIEEIIYKYNLYIVSDEIHSDIVFNNNKHIVLGSLSDKLGERSIICTAASKTFNIAGLQCSNIFIQNDKIREKFIKNNEGIGIDRANVLGLVATEIAYKNGLNWLKEVKEIIDINNNITKEFFENYNNTFKVIKPQASFLVWVNFQNSGIKHEDFIKFLDEKCEFFVTDGLMFGENGRNFIRINTGLPTKELEKALERLKENLKEKFNI